MFSGVTLLGFDLRPFMVVRYQVYPLNVKNMTKVLPMCEETDNKTLENFTHITSGFLVRF